MTLVELYEHKEDWIGGTVLTNFGAAEESQITDIKIEEGDFVLQTATLPLLRIGLESWATPLVTLQADGSVYFELMNKGSVLLRKV